MHTNSVKFHVKDVQQFADIISETTKVEMTKPSNRINGSSSGRGGKQTIKQQTTIPTDNKTMAVKAPLVQQSLRELVMPNLRAAPRGDFVRAKVDSNVASSSSGRSSPITRAGRGHNNNINSSTHSGLKESSKVHSSLSADVPTEAGSIDGSVNFFDAASFHMRPFTSNPAAAGTSAGSSGKRRPNSGSSVRRLPPPGRWREQQQQQRPQWDNSQNCPDRDLLALQQDLEIHDYRSKHRRDLLFKDPLVEPPPAPTLADSLRRSALKSGSKIDGKQRCLHHSFRAVANNDLPFHPLLKELQDHGIHSCRWCVGYERLEEENDLHKYAKPAERADKMQHEAFWREFHHSQYETSGAAANDSETEDEVEVFRHMESIASSYSRIQQQQQQRRK